MSYTMPTKVLFLDIDGVLNSMRTCIAFGGYPRLADHELSKFDTTAVGLIRKLCERAEASVVISSSWRIGSSVNSFGYLELPIIDMTPVRSFADFRRGLEIKEWLTDHPEITGYAIVDDDSDMLEEQLPYFVKINYDDGLTYRDFKALLEVLSPEEASKFPPPRSLLGVSA